MFQDDHYVGPTVDVWALGILLFFMVTAHMPFHASTVNSLKNLILEGNFTIPSHVSVECSTLLRSILKKKPSQRASLTDISESVWVGGSGEWIQAEAGYRGYPRLGSDNLSETEKRVFDQLSEIGISQAILKQDIMLGVRSPVIATYRILLHKQLMNNAETSLSRRSLQSSGTSSSILCTSMNEVKIVKDTNKEIVSLPHVGKKSKVCIIL